jgi:hypothetical protein
MSGRLALALLLALASAGALNWGFYRQHEQASTLPPLSLAHPLRSLRVLFGNRRWLVGFLVGILGWVFYVSALAFGPLSLVQAASAGGIGVLALLVWRWGGVALARREWLGVGVSVAGLVLLGVSLLGRGGNAHHWGSHGSWIAISLWLVASGVLAAFFAGPGRKLVAAGAGFGIGAGFFYAAGDVGTKAAVAGGWRLLFIPALLAAHGLGFILLQLGFQRGSALATAGVATLFTNATPIAAGMALFHEPLPGGARGVLRVLAFAAVVVGAVLLTRATGSDDVGSTADEIPRGERRPRAAAAGSATRALAVVAAVGAVALFAGGTVSVASVRSVAISSSQQRSGPIPLPSEETARLEGKPVDTEHLVRVWTIVYRASDGFPRHAYVVLPRWYGPKNNPLVPLVISPHGRGVPATKNLTMWGDLPALGRFAVINPEGQGRKLVLYSWGDPEEITDLSRMPLFLRQAMPWLRIAPHRVYAFGGSMGGQETLLLVAQYPKLLAGAAAFDAPTDLKTRYQTFPGISNGSRTRALLRLEVGGTPWQMPHAYAIRSPLDWAKQIAFSRVPLQIWWSTRDQVVTNQAQQSGLLYREIKSLNPAAPVTQVVGTWRHSAEMPSVLPRALARFGLMPPFRTHAPGLTA